MSTDPSQLIGLALDEAEKAVAGTQDAREQFRLATSLAGQFRRCAERIAAYRGRAVTRIRDDEKLTLRGLADELGVSHQRLGQLLDNAEDR